MGDGEVQLLGVTGGQVTGGHDTDGFGFAMCGMVDSSYVSDGGADDGGAGHVVADKVRVTHVVLQDLHKCASPDYVVKFEPVEDVAVEDDVAEYDGERTGLGNCPDDAMIVKALACPDGELQLGGDGGDGRCFHSCEWFKLDNGWRVRVYFDGDEVDYVYAVESPDGKVYMPSVPAPAGGQLPFGDAVCNAKVPLAEAWIGRGRTTGVSWADYLAKRPGEFAWNRGQDGVQSVRLQPKPQTQIVDLPPLPEGYKRLIVVSGSPDEGRAIADSLASVDATQVVFLRKGETLVVHDLPPKPDGHKRVVTIDGTLSVQQFQVMKAHLRQMIDADGLVMTRDMRVEDVSEEGV